MIRLLFLTHQLPYPPISGGVIKSLKLVNYLTARYEMKIISLQKENDEKFVQEFRTKISPAKFYSVPINVPRSVANYMRSIISRIPLSVYRNKTSEMKLMVEKEIDKVDVIFVDHFVMFQYVPAHFSGRVVLHQHNAEYIMWQRFAKLEKNLFLKFATYIEAKRIRNYEKIIGRCSHVVLAAPNDIKNLSSIGVPKERFIETLHLGDEELLYAPDISFRQTEFSLLFIGSLDWEANRSGLLWFLQMVWPILADKYQELRFTIIGRNPGNALLQEVKRLQGVELLGFVDNVEHFYAQSRVFLAPLLFGSGIKVKIINALYRGLPISTTTIGAEGLDIVSGHEIFIANEADEMAKQIGILLENEDQWTKFRDAGRALAKKKYTWSSTLLRVKEAVDG